MGQFLARTYLARLLLADPPGGHPQRLAIILQPQPLHHTAMPTKPSRSARVGSDRGVARGATRPSLSLGGRHIDTCAQKNVGRASQWPGTLATPPPSPPATHSEARGGGGGGGPNHYELSDRAAAATARRRLEPTGCPIVDPLG